MTPGAGFDPPPYPYERLGELQAVADALPGGCVDLSIGTPTDPPPAVVLEAFARSGSERGYPPSVGSPELREAGARWLERRFGASVDPGAIGACIGTKEFVASLPAYLKLRRPDLDTVLYPAVSYPTYAMGATLARCRAVPVPLDDDWCLDLDAIDPADRRRALCLWANTPGNPAGGLDDLAALAAWGREHDVVIASDECYIEFTWRGDPHTILESGLDGVVALHSLSKRSNLAGGRVGLYAGDPALIHYLRETRKHAGLMVPGPSQAAGAAALDDDAHVAEQRARYDRRLDCARQILTDAGYQADRPGGGFYLWVPAPDGDAWALARRLAEQGGAVVSPGEFYGEAGAGHVRLAMVRPIEALELVAERLAAHR